MSERWCVWKGDSLSRFVVGSLRFYARVVSCFIACCVLLGAVKATEPFFEKSVLFEEQTDGLVLYRIPGIVETAKGTVLAYCEATKFSIAEVKGKP